MAITGLEAAEADPLVKVFVAGAAASPQGLRTSGGRILGVTALGEGLAQAQKRAYQAVGAVHFDNCHFRRDVGDKGIKRSASWTKVAIFIGSISDEDVMRPCSDVLKDLGVPHVFTVTSAHRTPERTESLVASLEAEGCQVFICAAGMAAHLAGAVAARTVKPVLGVPVNASSLGGLDALLATVQMPPGFPVGTVAIDKAGARNAAWLAAQILALNDPELAQRIKKARQGFAEGVAKAARDLESKN